MYVGIYIFMWQSTCVLDVSIFKYTFDSTWQFFWFLLEYLYLYLTKSLSTCALLKCTWPHAWSQLTGFSVLPFNMSPLLSAEANSSFYCYLSIWSPKQTNTDYIFYPILRMCCYANIKHIISRIAAKYHQDV